MVPVWSRLPVSCISCLVKRPFPQVTEATTPYMGSPFQRSRTPDSPLLPPPPRPSPAITTSVAVDIQAECSCWYLFDGVIFLCVRTDARASHRRKEPRHSVRAGSSCQQYHTFIYSSTEHSAYSILARAAATWACICSVAATMSVGGVAGGQNLPPPSLPSRGLWRVKQGRGFVPARATPHQTVSSHADNPRK